MEEKLTFEELENSKIEQILSYLSYNLGADEYINETIEGIEIHAYLSPDRKVLLVKEEGKRTLQYLSTAAFLGFSLGDNVPSVFKD